MLKFRNQFVYQINEIAGELLEIIARALLEFFRRAKQIPRGGRVSNDMNWSGSQMSNCR